MGCNLFILSFKKTYSIASIYFNIIFSSSDFDTISVSVDLMGETRVVNHPLSITFSTLQTLQSGQQIDVLRSFTATQATSLWQDYTLIVEDIPGVKLSR